MNINKNDYKVTELMDGFSRVYCVKKRVLWFFWKTVKHDNGHDKWFLSKRKAQAYINFLK
jgi:hypothetical protein